MRKTLLATALLAAGLAACASAPATTASGEGASATEAAAMSPRRREVRRSFQALARRLAGAEQSSATQVGDHPLRRPAPTSSTRRAGSASWISARRCWANSTRST